MVINKFIIVGIEIETNINTKTAIIQAAKVVFTLTIKAVSQCNVIFVLKQILIATAGLIISALIHCDS